MLSKLLDKIHGYSPQEEEITQQVEPTANPGAASKETSEIQSSTVSEEGPAPEPEVWRFAWVFPDEVYHCGMTEASERLNQLVGIYRSRMVQDTDRVVGYCSFGEVDLVPLSREEILRLNKRFIQCALPLASAQVLWQYGLLNLDNAVYLQQGKFDRFPQVVVEQLRGLVLSEELLPTPQALPLTKDRIETYFQTGKGLDGLSESLSHIADKRSVQQVTRWLVDLLPDVDINLVLPLVDKLVMVPVAQQWLPKREGEQTLVEAIAKLPAEQINPLLNLYCTVHHLAYEGQKQTLQNEIDSTLDQRNEWRGYRPTPLWIVHRLENLYQRRDALMQESQPYATIYKKIEDYYNEQEAKSRLKKFQALCQSELDEERLTRLDKLITADFGESLLQQMAGIILSLGIVGRYPEKAQFLTDGLLRAATLYMDVDLLVQLGGMREQIDTLDNISRLFLLSENQLVDQHIAETEERIKSLSDKLSDGSLCGLMEQAMAQDQLDEAEEQLKALKERQPELHELVGLLGVDRPERGYLLALVNECLEQGPAKRLAEASEQDRTLMECVGLDGLMDQLLSSAEKAPSSLLYGVLEELQRLWEPMMAHGYYFVGYGIRPNSPLTGGQRPADYEKFVEVLEGTESVDEVFPLFINCLRQYANRYDWVRGFGEGAEGSDRETVVATLNALAANNYADYLDLFDSPESYTRHGGRGLERFQVLKRLKQLIVVQKASRAVASFKEGQETNSKLDIAALVLRNEAYRALNQIKQES